MKKWTQQDLNQIKNILIALKKAKYEVHGEEILAFGQAVRWISMLYNEVEEDLKPKLPSKTEVIAKLTDTPKSKQKSNKKKK